MNIQQPKHMNKNIFSIEEDEATSSPSCSMSNTGEESENESAWTLYLQPHSCNHHSDHDEHRSHPEEEEEEEDLSMVSDASSGPPHLVHDNDEDDEIVECRVINKRKSQCLLHRDLGLDDTDDTASSPLCFPSPKHQKKIGFSDDNGEDEGDFCSLHSYMIYSSTASHFQVI